MARTLIIVGALLALVGVAMGAFGAHALRERVSGEELEIWKTATAYQMWHALGVIAVGILIMVSRSHGYPHPTSPGGGGVKAWVVAGWLFVVGVVVFSGSLYGLVLSGERWLGAVTPVGGVAMMAGWLSVAWGAWRPKNANNASNRKRSRRHPLLWWFLLGGGGTDNGDD